MKIQISKLVSSGLLLVAITVSSTFADGPPAFCALDFDTGMCRAFIPRFYYDVNEGKCKEFVYGGCAGNENNFSSRDNCTAICTPKPGGPTFATKPTTAAPTTQAGLPSLCYLNAEGGNCNNYNNNMIIRYYYNPINKACQVFMWSGCGGNANRFEDAKACQDTCKASNQRITVTGRVFTEAAATTKSTKTSNKNAGNAHVVHLPTFLLTLAIAKYLF